MRRPDSEESLRLQYEILRRQTKEEIDFLTGCYHPLLHPLPGNQDIVRSLMPEDGDNGVVVYGPSGNGKSTFLNHVEHILKTTQRDVYQINYADAAIPKWAKWGLPQTWGDYVFQEVDNDLSEIIQEENQRRGYDYVHHQQVHSTLLLAYPGYGKFGSETTKKLARGEIGSAEGIQDWKYYFILADPRVRYLARIVRIMMQFISEDDPTQYRGVAEKLFTEGIRGFWLQNEQSLRKNIPEIKTDAEWEYYLNFKFKPVHDMNTSGDIDQLVVRTFHQQGPSPMIVRSYDLLVKEAHTAMLAATTAHSQFRRVRKDLQHRGLPAHLPSQFHDEILTVAAYATCLFTGRRTERGEMELPEENFDVLLNTIYSSDKPIPLNLSYNFIDYREKKD